MRCQGLLIEILLWMLVKFLQATFAAKIILVVFMV
jgi:hypothetical protein